MKVSIKMKKITFILIAASLLLSACTSTDIDQPEAKEIEKETNTVAIEVINDTPAVFENLMQGDFLLLDVRTEQEYSEGNIEGSLLIPVVELEDRIDEIADYKDKPVLVYCRSGNRSLSASYILIGNGFTNVHNLLTGYNGWTEYKNN